MKNSETTNVDNSNVVETDIVIFPVDEELTENNSFNEQSANDLYPNLDKSNKIASK